jgi:hypothetical protein
MYGIYINHIINNNNSTNAMHSPVGTLYCQSLYIYILYENFKFVYGIEKYLIIFEQVFTF